MARPLSTTAPFSRVSAGRIAFRPLKHEHWINPILYAEFEDVNGADKILKEVVGHDVETDKAGVNAEARAEREREFELKLILSSNLKGWNLSETSSQ